MTRTSAKQQPQAEDYELVLAQERLVVDVQVAIQQLLVKRGLRQSDLADLLGVSAARVSQMFGDEARNLTLRTLGRIFHVLGTRCVVREADDGAAVDPAAADTPAPECVEADEEASEVRAAPADIADFVRAVASRGSHEAWFEMLDPADLLSENAAFAKNSVWVLGETGRLVVANENHPVGSGRGRSVDAERWARADSMYAYG